VKGWSGKRIRYMSYPLKHCAAFEVKSAGMVSWFDSARAIMYTDVPGAAQITQDLHKATTDIWSVQTMMATKTLPPILTQPEADA